MGTSGSGQSRQRDDHEAHRRGTDVRHALETQREHVAFPRRDAAGQGIVQVFGVVRGQVNRRIADHIPRHGFLPERSLRCGRGGTDEILVHRENTLFINLIL